MLRGIDVASVNGASAVRAAILDKATAFVIVKASEGRSWNDLTKPDGRPRRPDFVAWARDAGKLIGHYHFAWPTNDPIAEARNFLACAKPRPGDLLVLDLEKTDGASWSRRLSYALSWLAFVKRETGASPVIYLNQSWAKGLRAVASAAQWRELTSYPLWIADYSSPLGSPNTVGWPVWTLHQRLTQAQGLDLDVLNGDASTWRALAVPGAKPTSTTPAPKPVPAPVPAPPKEPWQMIARYYFGEGADLIAAVSAARANGGAAVASIADARELIAAGARVIVIGTQECAELGLSWAVRGKAVTQGNVTACPGADYAESAALALGAK